MKVEATVWKEIDDGKVSLYLYYGYTDAYIHAHMYTHAHTHTHIHTVILSTGICQSGFD